MSSIVLTIVILAAIAWVAYLGISALRSRGSEEIASNLAPGTTDDEMETRRLEGIQLSAVVLSGILAVSIPVYYLTETNRQEGFVEEFHETEVERGHEWYLEFGCGGCHGPDGGGGAASYVEKRTGVTVNWTAPSINDVFYRYDREEVKYWLVYGRGNSPMPAWGLPGGGPMNDAQIEELLDYLSSDEFLVEQSAMAAKIEPTVTAQLSRLDDAAASVAGALLAQQQLVADILRAGDIEPELAQIARDSRAVLDNADDGIDTDGDGLSDSAEEAIVGYNLQAREVLLPDPLSLNLTFQPDDPDTNGIPDLEAAQDFLGVLRTLADAPLEDGVTSAPALGPIAEAVQVILAGGTPEDTSVTATDGDTAAEGDPAETGDATEEVPDEAVAETDTDAAASEDTADPDSPDAGAESEGAESEGAESEPADDSGDGEATPAPDPATTDTDDDGLTDAQEQQLNAQIAAVLDNLVGNQLGVVNLDPTMEETSLGVSDLLTAREAVASINTASINATAISENIDRVLTPARDALANLEDAAANARWEFDFEGIAANNDGFATEDAQRVVGIYNGYCARCHTSGYSAGLAFTQEAGAGGLGPALWDGRPAVQFLEDQDLIDFLTVGAEPNEPYGVNGFGSGRMPAFGAVLSSDDLALLAQWLRTGDLTGQGDTGRSPDEDVSAGGNG